TPATPAVSKDSNAPKLKIKKLDNFKVVDGEEVDEKVFSDIETTIMASDKVKDLDKTVIADAVKIAALHEAGCVITKLNYGDSFDPIEYAIKPVEKTVELEGLSEEGFLDML